MTSLQTAWQAALAAEQQASFGYGLLGPRLTGSAQALAVTCSDAHDDLRNATTGAIASTGATPVAAQADYPALYPVADAAAARALAIRLEQSCASAWRYLFSVAADTTGTEASAARAAAQSALTASAVRATTWSHTTSAFPGI